MPTPRLAFAAFTLAAATSWAQPACEKLANTHFSAVTITSATSIPGGTFTAPADGPRIPTFEAPPFCRVAAVVGNEVKFELWMPLQWNTKLLSVGNGGLAGTISYAPMVKSLQEGYATSSTDTDHAAAGANGPHFVRSRSSEEPR